MGFIKINGHAYKEEGPWCELCGTHIGGLLYCRELQYTDRSIEKDKRNPMWQDYGGGKCSHCGQEYEYEEGYFMKLTKHQLTLLRKDKEL